jgi:NAD(P)-dependent dehydrogenase (short-subunit alcohol dehydrogenase family)
MDLQLSGQHAVIIGGSSGIGRAMVDSFLVEGCHVDIIDLQAPADLGGEVGFHEIDITDADALAAYAAGLDRVDHVAVTAAIGSGKFGFPFWNLDPADWRKVIEVNVLGAANCAHAFAPQLIEREGGTLLFLTSVAAQIGSQTDPPYSASKAAVINLMQCAARDLAPYGCRANALSPGMVRTPLNESVWDAAQKKLPESERQSYHDWGQEKISRVAPLGRWQEPAEFGAMATYLASPHARNITGQTINIDAGQVMHS